MTCATALTRFCTLVRTLAETLPVERIPATLCNVWSELVSVAEAEPQEPPLAEDPEAPLALAFDEAPVPAFNVWLEIFDRMLLNPLNALFKLLFGEESVCAVAAVEVFAIVPALVFVEAPVVFVTDS